MGYGDGMAKETGDLSEDKADLFLNENGFESVKPLRRNGVDRIVSLFDNPNKVTSVQIKGRRQIENPRWFQLSVPVNQLRDAKAKGQDLNELWKDRIYMVDFWLLVSIPKNEIWVFPSRIIHEIADINFAKYKTRQDNDYSQIFQDKNGKDVKKQKELNLDICDENGIQLFIKYKRYLNDASYIHDFLNQ